ncbi:ShlB/FhaC/HecB family hemolysin secretion/activation protein [Komarekiella sp. 'clone 1']|uniref:ShlB/FhaC/HecB family hemolysin secretion/activation protein n=1 Tax=Komarekiella delphini-convector SJRDD-AB1 TaxID=2593771 RepID=A0AA40SXP6_9NOST|nr:ShlB/FhaC/HecB family hemolysin secretion/activation protein [Komarekiella delphini-convector]MBD6617231.1 ShlB/FhaC/HecB family hemolysin secretion/activation protein [Komarekiella delphini-convector SJRDD-AB1]
MNLSLRVKTIVLTFFSCTSNPYPLFAQSTPPSGVTIPPNTPGKVEQTIPQPIPSPTYSTPSSPSSPILSPNPTENLLDTIPTGESFFVKEIQIIGNTVLKKEIAKLKQILENKDISFEQLLELRSQITQLYIKEGYITSGAFLLNNQNLNSGIVQIQIVEGELEAVELSGLQRLQEEYVRSRIARATQIPLNQKRLEQALQLLQVDPLIARVNAELTAGSTPGSNILRLQIKEAPAFHAGIEIANSQSPSIGSEQGSVFIEHENLMGFGDKFYAKYGITEGLNLYDFSYNVPFNALDGTIGIRYNNSDSKIIEDDFRDLDIRSESRTLSFNVRQPLQRTPESEFALGLAFDLRRAQTFLLNDIPFSFSKGPEAGESKVTAIRFSQDWLQRDTDKVLAARSQFSIGIGGFDATVNDTGIDGRFFTWLGQFQWVQRLSARAIILAKIDVQLTGDSLLSIEKFSIGGVETVRGYNQNQVVTDNGIIASVEARIPLTSNTNTLQLVPFFDFGTGWNNPVSNSSYQTLTSLGLGLRWQPFQGLNLRADYAIPLFGIDNKSDSLQDNGFNFSLRYQPF